MADLITVGGLPTADVTRIVRKLAEALLDLHQTGRSYDRLTPATVAVQRVKPLRIDLSPVDDREESADDPFAAYLAPERVGTSGDWWSLGVVAHQLATGVTPFAQLDSGLVRHEIALRGMAVDDVSDVRLRRLCEGLLQPDPTYRWGGPEVLRWCSGGLPPVINPAATWAGWPLTIADVECWTREDAARAIREHWSRAADELCGPSTHTQLDQWLEHFRTDTMDRIRLTEQVLSRRELPGNLRLLFLLRWLDRRQPPTYLGQPMSLGELSDLARRAALEPEGPASQTVTALWLDRLLPVLADFADATPLRAVHECWLELAEKLDAALQAVEFPEPTLEQLPGLVAWQRAVLLSLAIQPVLGAELRRRAMEVRQDLGARVHWCRALPTINDTISAVVVMSVGKLSSARTIRPAGTIVPDALYRFRDRGTALAAAPGIRLLVLPTLCLLGCLGPAALTHLPAATAATAGGLLGAIALCMGWSRRQLRVLRRRTSGSEHAT